MKRRGSALIMAIWLIAILSIIVLAFALEARQQAGINVYMRERARVNRLLDSGRVIAEVILTGYSEAPEWKAEQDDKKLFEEDRWYKEKQNLKGHGQCKTPPLLIDESDEDSGVVTIEVKTVNSGSKHAININNLSKDGGDSRYQERWWMIFKACGIPEELSTENDGTIKLWNLLIASWDDWRDEDDQVSVVQGEECGAEAPWYEEDEDDKKIAKEFCRRPRNAQIPDIQELGKVRGFHDYPELLVGGILNPWENDKNAQIPVKGISDYFCTEGGSKIDVNSASVEMLITVPGIFKNADGEEALDDAQILAQAIIDGKKEKPDYDVDETLTEWPYKDWSDLTSRVQDEDIGGEAQEYLAFGPEKDSEFIVKITGEAGGMKRSVEAIGYVKDKKVRYIEWKEIENE